MHAVLDVTTFEQFVIQMPEVQPEAHRTGSTRVFTWTFDDGSPSLPASSPEEANAPVRAWFCTSST